MGERGRRRAALPVLLAVSVLLLVALVTQDRRDQDTSPCDVAAVAAPDGRWCRVYQQDFEAPAALGTFTTVDADDWHLQPGHPYADTLRSYPDGWGTTADHSLNYASRTADVVPQVLGARGVFRVHGHSATVDGEVQPLGGSFYPVLDPAAPDSRQQVSQTYGRYTVRFATTGGYRADGTGAFPTVRRAASYGTAFLLWPANDRWTEGEVDFPEMAWGAPVSGAVHQIGRPEVNADSFTLPTTTADRWNTATIEWTPGLLVFSLNGVEVRRVSTDVPTTPMRWGFQSGGTDGRPAPDLSGYLYVDSISIDSYRSA